MGMCEDPVPPAARDERGRMNNGINILCGEDGGSAWRCLLRVKMYEYVHALIHTNKELASFY